MKAYILRRLLLTIPLLLGISFVSFVIIQLSPSDPAEVVVRVNEIEPTDEVVAITREQLGLNKPFLTRYADWLCAVAQGDLGRRYVDNKPVAQELARALPPTVWLALTATLFMAVCSVGMAFVCAMYEGRSVDYGPAETVFNAPQHEYTQYLIRTRLALTRGFEAMLERAHA